MGPLVIVCDDSYPANGSGFITVTLGWTVRNTGLYPICRVLV